MHSLRIRICHLKRAPCHSERSAAQSKNLLFIKNIVGKERTLIPMRSKMLENKTIIKSGISYFLIVMLMLLYSYIYSTKIMDGTAQSVVRTFPVLLFAELFSILCEVLVYFIFLKIVKIKTKFAQIHNQIILILTIRKILCILVNVLFYGNSQIITVIWWIIFLIYIPSLTYIIKNEYKVSGGKTIMLILFSVAESYIAHLR